MLIPEAGVHQTSERYFFTPSSLARDLFYYATRCGHYFCNHLYSFSHRSMAAISSGIGSRFRMPKARKIV